MDFIKFSDPSRAFGIIFIYTLLSDEGKIHFLNALQHLANKKP